MNGLRFFLRPALWLVALSQFPPVDHDQLKALVTGDVHSEGTRRLRTIFEWRSRMVFATMDEKVHPVAAQRLSAATLRRQTDMLPAIDRVTVFALGGREPRPSGIVYLSHNQTYPYVGQKSVGGKEAQSIASLWRRLKFNPNRSALCHEPPYALKFEHRGEVVFESSVCWECNNFYVTGDDGEPRVYGFVADDRESIALLDRLRRVVKNPQLEKKLSKGGGQ